MTKARKELVSLETTPYYHVVSRCVRRAFLCGTDAATGNCYEHRRQWIEDKILELATIFSIEICAYSVMSNHYHIVLHINKDQAEDWDMATVISRWHQLYKGNLFSQKFSLGEKLPKVEQLKLAEIVKDWRKRLYDLGQFMQVLNESVAREANKEDACTGRFWEGRYRSQALLDEAALAACMAYVDLNPVRAKMADTPETSDHTSARKRIKRAEKAHSPNHPAQQAQPLMPFAGNPRQNMPHGLPFRLTDYLELLDWTGRILREDKRGAIPTNTPPIIQRLKIDTKHWIYCTSHFESRFKNLVGRVHKLKAACKKLGYQRTPGISACRALLS